MSNLSDMPNPADMLNLSDMSPLPDMPNLSDMPHLPDMPNLSDIPHLSDMSNLSDMKNPPDMSNLSDTKIYQTRKFISREKSTRHVKAVTHLGAVYIIYCVGTASPLYSVCIYRIYILLFGIKIKSDCYWEYVA